MIWADYGYSENLLCPTISSLLDTQKIFHAQPFLHYLILRKSSMPHHFFTIGYSENLPCPTISSLNLPYPSISSLFGYSFFNIGYTENLPCPTISSLFDTQKIVHAPSFLHYWILRKSSKPHHFFTIVYSENLPSPTISSLLITQKTSMPNHFFTIGYSENLPDPPFLHY